MKLRLSRYRWQSSCFTVPGLQLEVWAMMPAWFTLSEACGCFSSQKPNFFLDYRWPYCPLVFSLCPTHKDLDYRAHISTEILFLPLHENAASLEHSADRESVFVSRAAVPYAPSKWVLIFFFFFQTSTPVLSIFHFLCFCPMSGPTFCLPGRNTSQDTTSLHFINKTYKEINGNLKDTKIHKNIYFERARQAALKDTL